MANGSGTIASDACEIPVCQCCGLAYPLAEKHDCVFGQEAKLMNLQAKNDALNDALIAAQMNIRDQFAMAAVSGFNKTIVAYGWEQDVLAGYAKKAYAIADAMLAARNDTERLGQLIR